MQDFNAVIISLHPQHANKILSGEKKVEFRRVWSKKSISTVVIYSTVPVRRIVAVARVKQVHFGSPTSLWKLSKSIGGGLSRKSLYDYFFGKKTGYAIEFESIFSSSEHISPYDVIENFHAPQSFSYLDKKTVDLITKHFKK
jgi:predicted transcriptional regulator